MHKGQYGKTSFDGFIAPHENYLVVKEAENVIQHSRRYPNGDEIKRGIEQFAQPQAQNTS